MRDSTITARAPLVDDIFFFCLCICILYQSRQLKNLLLGCSLSAADEGVCFCFLVA